NMDDAFRVLFDTNGGNTIQPQTGLSYGDRITQPADPVKNGCIFAGWYCDEACTKPWNFADGIPGDMILYAKWNCEATPPTTATSTATVTLTIQPTPGPTGEPTGRPTRDPQPTGDIGNKPAGTTQHLLGILLFLFLLILLLLILLLRHTVTFFIPAAGKITEYRIKVWHGKHINPDTLPALLRSAAWYLDPERRERWDFDEDRVRKSIKLYLG
nr:InlB B-repeat-containing protein [Methanocorpusculum sp.]